MFDALPASHLSLSSLLKRMIVATRRIVRPPDIWIIYMMLTKRKRVCVCV